jgi:diguanylate cyclase (GGDEF)-like protein
MVLIHLVKNISSQLRANDIFGRIGGEEFVILFPELDKENAQNVTQRLLNTVSQEEILAYDQKLKVTISIGATVWEGEDSKVSLEELIQKADKALYMSKAAGRNQATFI